MVASRSDFVSWTRKQTRNFNQLCQAWTWNVCAHFGSAPAVYPSARAAYLASKIVSKDPSKAPGGAIHYWPKDTVYGHVAPGSGPNECIMATARSGSGFERLNSGSYLSLVRVSSYGAEYGGWSYTNGRNSFKLSVPKPPKAPVPVRVAKTTTSVTGSPGSYGSNAWKRVQLLATHGGYRGPVDGKPGEQTWRGVQSYLKKLGLYAGDVDGKPLKLTYAALQRWGGVSNPTITNSWRNISRANWRKVGAKLNTLT